MPKRTTQIRIAREGAQVLRRLSLELGFVQGKGPTVGEGSIVQMLDRIVLVYGQAPEAVREGLGAVLEGRPVPPGSAADKKSRAEGHG